MAQNNYRPNYAALYPGVEISAEVMDALRKSDRKMKYMEQDLKIERPAKSTLAENPRWKPAREDSFDRLLETDKELGTDEDTPEQLFMAKADLECLPHCLKKLDESEHQLIQCLFYLGMTELEYAKTIGITQQAVSKRKTKVLAKLKILMTG